MDDEILIERAYRIAVRAHKGQYRRNGKPYLSHVKSVAHQVRGNALARAVALLHDVLEDGIGATPDWLRAQGIPETVVRAVVILTRRKDQSYEDYLNAIQRHSLARQVKIADMRHNLHDDPTPDQASRYRKGLQMLTARTHARWTQKRRDE